MHEVKEILTNDYLDILCISETKLDDSFPTSQFHVNDYQTHRRDRNAVGGGLLVYVRSSIPHRLRTDILCDLGVEIMVIEVMIRGEKMLFVFLYKPPSISIQNLITVMSKLFDRFLTEVRSVFIAGDINIDMNCTPRSFCDFMDMYNLVNIVDKPTCFKSVENPSLIDVVLTNTPKRLASHLNVGIGVSDHHNIICAATRMHLARNQKRKIQYRSMKNFSADNFNEDVATIPFQVCEIFDDPDDVMWSYNKLFLDVIDEHAPIKYKVLKKPQVKYMNGALRKAINIKGMLRRKYERYKDNHSWYQYRTQRNRVTAMKRKSIDNYFDQRCNSAHKSTMFWKTVKPFITESASSDTHVFLQENDQLITDQSDVCSVFNEYFVNIANDLLENVSVTNMDTPDVLDHYHNHDAVKFIRERNKLQETNNFVFKHTTVNAVNKKLSEMKVNKACGYDLIPARFLKHVADVLSPSLTSIINICIDKSIFPDCCKYAEVSPVYKKKDQMNKCNYRPVSILTALSKVIEGIMCDQLMFFFETRLTPELSAYRSKYSCANVILKCVEDWRLSLDKNEKIGCVAMDLSRAFDTIPHGLLVAKLHAYGVELSSCNFIRSYLSERQQRVKLGQTKSDWMYVKKGVPQGSLMGPVLFNIFINDLINMLRGLCCIYNYADDNTLSFSHSDTEVILNNLEKACDAAVKWFEYNRMRVNPEKFQFMMVSRQACENIVLHVNGLLVSQTDCIKILGITIDNTLTFKNHVSDILKRCAKQVNALSRLSHVLSVTCKVRILHAFIMSNLSYCCVVYHGCGISNARALEKMLRRALQFVFLDFDSKYFDLLSKAKVSTLYENRQRQILLSVHKILSNDLPPMSQSFYSVKENMYNCRVNNKLVQGRFNTILYGFNAMRYQGAILWNKLPDAFKSSDFNVFKSHVYNALDLTCRCGNCFYCSLYSI